MPVHLRSGLAFSSLGGVASGLVGIGGGPVMVPYALRFRSQGLIDLGILVLLLTSGTTVVASQAVAIGVRDRLFIGVCALLVSIILGGLMVSLL